MGDADYMAVVSAEFPRRCLRMGYHPLVLARPLLVMWSGDGLAGIGGRCCWLLHCRVAATLYQRASHYDDLEAFYIYIVGAYLT